MDSLEDDYEKIDDDKLDQDIIALNWALNAEALQQDMYMRLGNRIFDEYSINEAEYLEIKIAYAKFGPPVLINNVEYTMSYEEFQSKHHFDDQKSNIIQAYPKLYSRKQRKQAHETLEIILNHVKKLDKNVKNFHVSFIFVVYQLGETELCGLIPIIRVLRQEADPEDEAWYIDQENRVYKSWKCFLEENRLPPMRICYPKNGYYSVNAQGYSIFMPERRVVVEFGLPPSAKFSRKILHSLDWTSSGVLIGSLGIAVALALGAPISAPILSGAVVGSSLAAFYGATRSGARLVDRKIHDQTINVTNPEARACWIGIGGAVFALGANSVGLLLQKAATLGQVAHIPTLTTQGTTSALTTTAQGFSTGSLVFGAFGMANQVHNFGERIVQGKSISAFEVFEFTLNTFLFTNSLMSFNMANTQISKGNDVLTDGMISETTTINQVNRLVKQVKPESQVDRNSRIIHVFDCIQSPDQFFAKYSELRKQINRVSGKPHHESTFYLALQDSDGMSPSKSMPSFEFKKLQATINNLPRTSSEPLFKECLSIIPFYELCKKEFRNRIQEILLNDYKFLILINLADKSIKEVQSLESQISGTFAEIQNKDIVYGLVQISIIASKQLGINNQEEFVQICTSVVNFFIFQEKLSLNQMPKTIEQELLGQLKDSNSYFYQNLWECIFLEFFRKMNDRTEHQFASSKTVYELYKTYADSISDPITPKQFMQKVDWLFNESEPISKQLYKVELNGKFQYQYFYKVDGWHGSYVQTEDNPKNKTIIDFGYTEEDENLIEKIESLIKK